MGLWWADLKEAVHVQDQGANGKIILKLVFKEIGWSLIGLEWLWMVICAKV
jgi:hypothetical protein